MLGAYFQKAQSNISCLDKIPSDFPEHSCFG